jgi:hypothetical protein
MLFQVVGPEDDEENQYSEDKMVRRYKELLRESRAIDELR